MIGKKGAEQSGEGRRVGSAQEDEEVRQDTITSPPLEDTRATLTMREHNAHTLKQV